MTRFDEACDCARIELQGFYEAVEKRAGADVVLANADLPYVYNDLLPDEDLAEPLTRKRFFRSVISFFWGLDQTYATLPPHTLFLADNYRENFESIIRDLGLPANPCLYPCPGVPRPIHVPGWAGYRNRDCACWSYEREWGTGLG